MIPIARLGRISSSRLVDLAKEKKPFRDLGEATGYYGILPYPDCGSLDEFMLPAAQLLKISKSDRVRY